MKISRKKIKKFYIGYGIGDRSSADGQPWTLSRCSAVRWNLFLRLSICSNFRQTYHWKYSRLFDAFYLTSSVPWTKNIWLSNSPILITHVARKIFSNVTVNFFTYLIKMTHSGGKVVTPGVVSTCARVYNL